MHSACEVEKHGVARFKYDHMQYDVGICDHPTQTYVHELNDSTQTSYCTKGQAPLLNAQRFCVIHFLQSCANLIPQL
jgi:hypothetical protein